MAAEVLARCILLSENCSTVSIAMAQLVEGRHSRSLCLSLVMMMVLLCCRLTQNVFKARKSRTPATQPTDLLLCRTEKVFDMDLRQGSPTKDAFPKQQEVQLHTVIRESWERWVRDIRYGGELPILGKGDIETERVTL